MGSAPCGHCTCIDIQDQGCCYCGFKPEPEPDLQLEPVVYKPSTSFQEALEHIAFDRCDYCERYRHDSALAKHYKYVAIQALDQCHKSPLKDDGLPKEGYLRAQRDRIESLISEKEELKKRLEYLDKIFDQLIFKPHSSCDCCKINYKSISGAV